MKKVLISMVLLVASVATTFAATATIRAKITMGTVANVTVREGADWSDAIESGYDAVAYNPGGIVVSANSERYSAWATNNLEGVKLEFTPTDANVTFNFSNVIGDLYLVDNAASPIVRKKIVDGESYAFTVEASEVGNANATRFTISKVGEPKPIFNNDKLTILGFAGKKVKVAKADGTIVEAEKTLASDNEVIDLSTKDAGRYVMTLDGKDYQIDVKVKDIPEAKYHIVTP